MKARLRVLALVIFVLSSVLMNGCLLGSVERFEFAHHKFPCYGLFPYLCIGDVDPDTGELSFFHGGIEGFDYQWGYRYKLDVRVLPVLNPPADGSSTRYELVDIVEKRPVDDEFELTLSSDHVSVDDDSGRLRLGEEIALRCLDASLCQTIADTVAVYGTVDAVLRYQAPDLLVIALNDVFTPGNGTTDLGVRQ